MIGERAFKLDMVSVRLVKDAPILSGVRIISPESAVEAMGSVMSEIDREVVAVINLKADGTPINASFVSYQCCSYRTEGAFKGKHSFKCSQCHYGSQSSIRRPYAVKAGYIIDKQDDRGVLAYGNASFGSCDCRWR